MSGIVADHLMSDEVVKSCSGIILHVSRLLSWVIFNVPSIVLANLLFTYFNAFSASTLLPNAPIPINVWVYPSFGAAITGLLKTSPKAPLPFTRTTNTFHLYKFSCSISILESKKFYQKNNSSIWIYGIFKLPHLRKIQTPRKELFHV